MKHFASITTVAEKAGVSKATVSRALRHQPGMAEDTRDRIFRIARELNYWPSPVRQGRDRVHHGQLGFVAISETEPRLNGEPGGAYLHNMLEGCRQAAEKRGSAMTTCRMTMDQMEQGQMPIALQAGRLDGIVLRGWWSPALAKWLQESKIPCVLVDCDQFIPDMPQVQIENVHAMDDVVGHLVGRGASQIATITGDMVHTNSQERLAGMQMAMTKRGLELPKSHIVLEKGYDQDSGIRGVGVLIERGIQFDALVCQNDLIALGAIHALKAAGKRVPDDVAVVGYDNMEFAGFPGVELTTVDSHPEELGALGTKLLSELLEGKSVKDVHLRVMTDLIVRKSA
ncbi:MAG: LacI family DNA-binding transcriptional regulator [Phycisphaerales bacterium]|jgi:DNA-binding LacI/PurR family transcriptional regulator|nr:LacI family DNA-binding transcriptional regulator [Phycisphaerales bacterium]